MKYQIPNGLGTGISLPPIFANTLNGDLAINAIVNGKENNWIVIFNGYYLLSIYKESISLYPRKSMDLNTNFVLRKIDEKIDSVSFQLSIPHLNFVINFSKLLRFSLTRGNQFGNEKSSHEQCFQLVTPEVTWFFKSQDHFEWVSRLSPEYQTYSQPSSLIKDQVILGKVDSRGVHLNDESPIIETRTIPTIQVVEKQEEREVVDQEDQEKQEEEQEEEEREVEENQVEKEEEEQEEEETILESPEPIVDHENHLNDSPKSLKQLLEDEPENQKEDSFSEGINQQQSNDHFRLDQQLIKNEQKENQDTFYDQHSN
ncbi:hypothetical protein DDB_G0281349 [Dictyostelium discoideum AX4]|uniref:Uncharacterized protein n=1 Tax=Dictyostelium discoideum TaxID=44689 RepID=Q54U26_DICDI|nr:hypothetical protein DDB_G0281349 [Dictyostelium discoideum AX4]EAL66760.1 hypothetical protein DDB_G0281349 [Dictyostelium discoideum AX4]|eukprot:XP_640739.1 hypothetical protein DDB_G0281349 [Dictyostelium discoideum AX4]